MNPVKVRNITIGEGTPKICVPIVGVTKEEILEAGKNICTIGADVIEWRVDWYENVFDFDQVEETAKEDAPVAVTEVEKAAAEEAASEE